MKDDKLDHLFQGDDDDLADMALTAPGKKSRKGRQFAIVPLDDDWGYRAVTAAGRGAAIVLYALHKQRTGNRNAEVPITAAVCQRFGIDRETRKRTLDRLVEAGLATVRSRGKFRGCPLLTLKPPSP
jgi:hypothetical protein